MRTSTRLAALAGVLALATLGVGGAHAAANSIYESIPSPQPSNLPSLGYQATQTAEFGDDISFAPGSRSLQTVNIFMSSWACENWAADAVCTTAPGATFSHPITLSFYSVTHDAGGAPVLGAQTFTVTKAFDMPFRPSADATCATATQWKNAAGDCFNGFGFVISFDLGGMTVPDELVYGIAYNTNTWGASPIGVNGPYESLNVGLAPNQGVGIDVDPDLVFWNTNTAANYTDGGAGGVDTFRADTNWASTGGPAAQFIAAAPVVTTTSTTIAAAGGPTTTTTTAVASGGATTTSVASLAPDLPATGMGGSGWLIAGIAVLVGFGLVLTARRHEHR